MRSLIQHPTDDRFYDDFPPEIIKEFNLKVSAKVKGGYKRHKVSDSQERLKPGGEDLPEPENKKHDFSSLKPSDAKNIQHKSSFKLSERSNIQEGSQQGLDEKSE